MTGKIETRRFRGAIPKEVFILGVVRIEEVRGASAVTLRLEGSGEETRYRILGRRIVQPERGPSYQFLVATCGDHLRFESDREKVFVEGIVAGEGKGPTVSASDCFIVPRPLN